MAIFDLCEVLSCLQSVPFVFAFLLLYAPFLSLVTPAVCTTFFSHLGWFEEVFL